MSIASTRALSLVNASTLLHHHASHAPMASDMPDVQHVLGPEERLLAMLPGADARGPATWVATSRRLIVITGSSDPDQDIAHVCHSGVMCVDVRTDPLGTTIKVRATGRHLRLHTSEAVLATHFGSLLRERAGLVASERTTHLPIESAHGTQRAAVRR